MSYTLSDISATFVKNASHLGSMDPYLDLIFPSPIGGHLGAEALTHIPGKQASHGASGSRVFKTTMVKGGGRAVAWHQPVLLTGEGTTLQVVAKAHKALSKDKTIGHGSLDLEAAAAQGGAYMLQLVSETGSPAGQVKFIVMRGASHAGPAANLTPPAPGGVVEGVGGEGRVIDDAALVDEGAPTGAYGGTVPGPAAADGGYNERAGAPGGGVVGGPVGGAVGDNYNAGTVPQGAGYGAQGGGNGFGGGAGGQQLAGPQGAGFGGGAGGQQLTGPQGAGVGGGVGAGGQQLAGQQGAGFGGGQQSAVVPGGNIPGGPTETWERKAHDLHDHDESESYERRHVH